MTWIPASSGPRWARALRIAARGSGSGVAPRPSTQPPIPHMPHQRHPRAWPCARRQQSPRMPSHGWGIAGFQSSRKWTEQPCVPLAMFKHAENGSAMGAAEALMTALPDADLAALQPETEPALKRLYTRALQPKL